MPRNPGSSRTRAAGRNPRIARKPGRTTRSTTSERNDTLEALSDHCTAALRIADAHGEKLLAYLLGIAELESAQAVRRHMAAVATEQTADFAKQGHPGTGRE